MYKDNHPYVIDENNTYEDLQSYNFLQYISVQELFLNYRNFLIYQLIVLDLNKISFLLV